MKGIQKRHEFLIDMITGYIARGKQEQLLKERERAVKISLTSTKTTPALEDAEKPAAPTKRKKEAAAAASSANDPKGIQKPRQRVRQLPSFQRLLRSLMPIGRTRRGREREEDDHHPLIRRRSFATTSSIKVGVTKVTNVFTVIPRKSMMPKRKTRKEEAEVEIRREGRVREVLRQLDQRRMFAGNGRKVPAHSEANVDSYMQTNHHQPLLKDQQEDHEEECNSHHH